MVFVFVVVGVKGTLQRFICIAEVCMCIILAWCDTFSFFGSVRGQKMLNFGISLSFYY